MIVDYAWSHPGGAALQAAGVQGAARYLGHDSTKDITRAEADDNAAHGVWSTCVFEDSAQRPLAGYAAGVADAQLAYAQAVAAGMPEGRPIYFAVDFDVTPDQQAAVNEYLSGAASVLGVDRTGVYGGFYSVERALDAGVARWAWQTVGWSGGQWDPRAHLQQRGGTVTINGVDCDRNTATTTDYGQWMPGITPEEDMPLTNSDAQVVAQAVWALGLPNYNDPTGAKITAAGAFQSDQDRKYDLLYGSIQALGGQLAASQAAITALATQLGQVHGVDTATVVAAVQQAIAAATVHVQVAVTEAPAAASAPAPTH